MPRLATLGSASSGQIRATAVASSDARAFSQSGRLRSLVYRSGDPVPKAAAPKPAPNLAMLAAIEKVDAIQEGMNPKPGKDALEYVREARAGGMYGYTSDNK